MNKEEQILLKEAIFSVYDIGDDAWSDMVEHWHKVTYSRKQVISNIGDIERYAYFVLDGVQRAYIEKSGKESTLVFSYRGSFSGVVDSFLQQKPSLYCLETISKSTLIRIHYNEFMNVLAKHKSLEQWIRIVLTQTLSGTLQRNIELLSQSAEERFTTMLRRSPHVLNMIPHKYLASYIGVDPATFSTLLSTVRI